MRRGSRVRVRRRRRAELELAEDATDRGLVPGERPLSFEVLVGLAAVVAAIARREGEMSLSANQVQADELLPGSAS